MSEIPEEFIDQKTRRLKWRYFLDDNAKPTPFLEEIKKRGEHGNFVKAALPYMIKYKWWREDSDEGHIDEAWMGENIAGTWQIWGKDELYFSRPEDAFAFKMRWG